MPKPAADQRIGLIAPGLYKHLAERRVRASLEPDPRGLLDADPRAISAYHAAKALAEEQLPAALDGYLRPGAPITAERFEVLGGHHGVPRDMWPQGWHGVEQFLVHSDDEVEPVLG